MKIVWVGRPCFDSKTCWSGDWLPGYWPVWTLFSGNYIAFSEDISFLQLLSLWSCWWPFFWHCAHNVDQLPIFCLKASLFLPVQFRSKATVSFVKGNAGTSACIYLSWWHENMFYLSFRARAQRRLVQWQDRLMRRITATHFDTEAIRKTVKVWLYKGKFWHDWWCMMILFILKINYWRLASLFSEKG